MANAIDILIEARRKIENPEKWLNRPPFSDDDFRCGRNCAATAIWRTRGSSPSPELERAGRQAYDALAAAMGVGIVPDFNDTHTHAEVLAAFDKAITTARATQSP